jgi:MFS superfamily sulfate permease-like transporter
MFALKHGYRLDSNREFLGLASANLAAGLGQGFPVSGGMSQSLVNDGGGARTPLSTLLASLIILVVTVFLSGLLADLPQPVLAAIVLMAVAGLFKIGPIIQLWKFSRGEFAVAMVALLGVLGSGMLHGVLIGAVMSILMLLHRASRPHVALMGQVPGSQMFGDVERHPENKPVPGVFVFRADASIVYFNTEFINDQFEDLLGKQGDSIKLVVWSMQSTVHVDLAGVEMLGHLHGDLARRGIVLKLAEMRGPLRQILRAGGLDQKFGHIEPNTTIHSVIQEWQTSEAAKG